MYSGGFNMKGMKGDDEVALKEFARQSCRNAGNYNRHTFADAAKFPFFGGKKAHDWNNGIIQN